MSHQPAQESGGVAPPEEGSYEYDLLHYRGIKPDLLDLWKASPERYYYLARQRDTKVRLRRIGYVGLAGVLFVAGMLLAFDPVLRVPFNVMPAYGLCLVAAAFFSLAWACIPYWSQVLAYRARKRAMAHYRVAEQLSVLCADDRKGEPLSLSGLFELNRRQLDEYVAITQHQERTAFFLSWIATVCAFLILAVGSIVTFSLTGGDPADRYVAGSLTALGTLMSGFLARTFYLGQAMAMRQLSYYYNEPNLTGRLIAAERLKDQVGAAVKDRLAAKIIAAILKAPMPPMDAGFPLQPQVPTPQAQTAPTAPVTAAQAQTAPPASVTSAQAAPAPARSARPGRRPGKRPADAVAGIVQALPDPAKALLLDAEGTKD